MVKNERVGINSLHTAFDVLETLQKLEKAGVTEIASEIGVSKSTVHDHLRTFEARGYVVRDDGSYRLGLRFLEAGEKARKQVPIYEASRQEVIELANTTGEHCQVFVEEHGRGVYVYQAQGGKAVIKNSLVGANVPFHSTSVGKAYLAHLNRDRVNQILDKQGMPIETDHTITDRDQLFEELERIREQGYAVSDEERIVGMRAIGAPILHESGRPLGSLSIFGPATRIQGERYETELPKMVQRVAQLIAIKVTY